MIYAVFVLCITLATLIALLLGLKLIFYSDKRPNWFKKIGIQPRHLIVRESLVLDPKRRIVLIHHNTQGYLILLGSTSETLLHGPFDVDQTQSITNDELDGLNSALPHTLETT